MARSAAIELSRIQTEPDSNNPQSPNSGPNSDSNAYNGTIGGGSRNSVLNWSPRPPAI